MEVSRILIYQIFSVTYNKCRPFRVLQIKMLLIGQILKQHTQKLKKCTKQAKDVDNSLYTFIARKTPGARKTLLAIFSSKVDKTSNKSNQDNKGDKNIFA